MSDECGTGRDASLQCRCPYSGRTWGTRSLAELLDPSCYTLEGGLKSVLTGLPSAQSGGQYWMNANVSGVIENAPDLATNAKYTSADYERDWISAYTKEIITVVSSPSTALQRIAATYPAPSQTSIDLAKEKDPLSALAASVPDSDMSGMLIPGLIIAGGVLALMALSGGKN